MAFPTIADTNTSLEDAGNVKSHTVSLPSNISSGDLLIVFFSSDGNVTVDWSGTGFTEIDGTSEGSVTLSTAYKQATGSEGATITVGTDGSERSAHAAYRITGHEDPSTQAPEIDTPGTGADEYPDPASTTPTGGAKDYLWIAVHGRDRNRTLSNYVTGFSLGQLDSVGGGSNSAGVSVCSLQENGSNKDPGTFTIGSSDGWVAHTVAIHPVGGAAAVKDVIGGGVIPFSR